MGIFGIKSVIVVSLSAPVFRRNRILCDRGSVSIAFLCLWFRIIHLCFWVSFPGSLHLFVVKGPRSFSVIHQ